MGGSKWHNHIAAKQTIAQLGHCWKTGSLRSSMHQASQAFQEAGSTTPGCLHQAGNRALPRARVRTHGDVAAMQSIHTDTISTRGAANFSSRDIPLISFVKITSPCDLGKHVVTIAAIRGHTRPGIHVWAQSLAPKLSGALPPANDEVVSGSGGRPVSPWRTCVRILCNRLSSGCIQRADPPRLLQCFSESSTKLKQVL